MRTTFTKAQDAQWYWHTQTNNNKVVADGGEGYHNLEDAIHGFARSEEGNDAITKDALDQFRDEAVEAKLGIHTFTWGQ